MRAEIGDVIKVRDVGNVIFIADCLSCEECEIKGTVSFLKLDGGSATVIRSETMPPEYGIVSKSPIKVTTHEMMSILSVVFGVHQECLTKN